MNTVVQWTRQNGCSLFNIAASDELTPEFAREAIDAVKSIDIDFEEIASQIESNRKAFVC